MHCFLVARLRADFDFTMTKFWVNDRRGDSCHAVIDESGLLAEGFHERTTELRNHYYPLEVPRGISRCLELVAAQSNPALLLCKKGILLCCLDEKESVPIIGLVACVVLVPVTVVDVVVAILESWK